MGYHGYPPYEDTAIKHTSLVIQILCEAALRHHLSIAAVLRRYPPWPERGEQQPGLLSPARLVAQSSQRLMRSPQ